MINYQYSDDNWKDKLTNYNGEKVIYDAIGNPLQYRDGWNFEWKNGRRLDKMLNNGYTISCEYDDAGILTQKTVKGVTTDFITDGNQILAQKTGDYTLIFHIDGNGQAVGFNYNGEQYFYLKNAQGDIIAIADAAGNIVAEYTYDSWGKLISVTDANCVVITDPSNVANVNPLRYRGCYFDQEIGLYYLNARYYDPETGRFINADNNLAGG